ncbi:MAG: cell division protein FtsA [Muribaculaceae bacterium]|nr:cell division protein FtsA [Muribaculaceae bacterium]
MKERYIAALEIGSSKITGAVGLYNPEDGTMKVLAVEQEESRDSVRYGIIHNPEEVAARVVRIVERLEVNPAVEPRRITGVYVGLSGRSMRSVASDVKLVFPDVTEITGDMLKRLKEDATALPIEPNQEILDVIPRSYQIDGLDTSAPKGAMGKSIAAVYDVIIGRNELKRNIKRALNDRTGLQIRGMLVTEVAAADIVLSDEEKRLGCMLVDFGSETTSVSIYRHGSLCYYATLPLGGRNITRDLTSLAVLEENAEEIKCESGRAVAPDTPSSLNLNGLKLSDVSNLVVARAEEIVANVIQQISYAGLTEKDLPDGIVCIGGGANLNGLCELIENQSGLNARNGFLPSFIVKTEPRAKRLDNVQVCALLYAGALKGGEECLEMPHIETPDDVDEPVERRVAPEPQEGKVSKFFNKISRGLGNFFATPPEDDSELE